MVKVVVWTSRRFSVQHHRQSVAMKGKVGYVSNQRGKNDDCARVPTLPSSHRNISAAEKSAIGTLLQNSKDREAIIKGSAKSKSLVVLKKDSYLAKASAPLADTERCEPADITAEALEKIV